MATADIVFSLREQVYRYIVGCGSAGATDSEIQAALKMNPSTQRPRRIELADSGQIVDSEMQRKTDSGRLASVWVAAEFSKKERTSMETGKAQCESVPCNRIKIADRSRKDMGDLQPLADSILQLGLLHPIVVTKDLELVCGERRLCAVRDILHEHVIDAKIIDLGDNPAVNCEHDENELRKAFTPSERVAIAAKRRELFAEQGERRGNPALKPIPAELPELEKGKETREAVAELAGFDSASTMRNATKVVESGCEELIDAMDAGTVSISRAAQLAALPKSEQRAEIAAGYINRIKDSAKSEAKKTVGKLAQALADGDFDGVGKEHQKKLRVLYAAMKEIGKIVTGLIAQEDSIAEAKKSEKWTSASKSRLRETLAGVQRDIKQLDRFFK